MYTREGVNNVFTARSQVETLTCGLVDSEIYVLGWQPVDFTAKFTPFTNRVGCGEKGLYLGYMGR